MPAQWPLPTDHQVGDPGFVEGVDQIAANANDLDTRVAALEGGSGGSGGATTLGGLTDVDTTGATPGEVLKYNGTEWAPDTAGGAGTWGSITGTLSAQTDLQTALAGKKDASWTPGLADLPGRSSPSTGTVRTGSTPEPRSPPGLRRAPTSPSTSSTLSARPRRRPGRSPVTCSIR
jgi:hypothetical protein